MDTIYKGLVSPRTQVAAGRPDIAEGERPGDILVDLVKEAAITGFARPEQEEVKGPLVAESIAPAARRSRDVEHEVDQDVELNG